MPDETPSDAALKRPEGAAPEPVPAPNDDAAAAPAARKRRKAAGKAKAKPTAPQENDAKQPGQVPGLPLKFRDICKRFLGHDMLL